MRKFREFEENIATKRGGKRVYAPLVLEYIAVRRRIVGIDTKKTPHNQHWAALRASVETVEVCASICARASV